MIVDLFEIIVRVSMAKFISYDLAAFHHESNAFEFGDVSDWITSDGNEVGKFSRFDAHPRDPANPAFRPHLLVIARMTSSAGMPASRKLTKVEVLASPRVFPG